MKRRAGLALGFALLVAAPAAPASAANDFRIVPGERVGPVTRTTTRDRIAGLFPGAKVSHEEMTESPCFGDADPVMTFVEAKGWGLSICWSKGRPSTVLASGPRWHAPSGVHPGMTLPQAEQANGRPLMLHGFLGCYLAIGNGGRIKVTVLIGRDNKVCAFPANKFTSDGVRQDRDDYVVKQLGVELN
jgi:hypothetical protein